MPNDLPNVHSKAIYWYHRAFKAVVQKAQLLQNDPDDWKRLQVWDGKDLKPVMGEGFSGEPTEAQINMLYSHVQKNELFFFELGNTTPKLVVEKGFVAVSMDPKAPEPVRPINTENMTEYQKNREIQRFTDDTAKYNTESHIYDTLQALHQKCGPGLKAAVEKYYADRNPEQDRLEAKSRGSKDTLEEFRINRARADRIITEMMSPHPGAPVDVFFEDDQTYNNATIDIKFYHKYLKPNEYNLPPNDKLTDYDAATINFAMLGVRSQMREVLHNLGGIGPKNADTKSKDGLHMLITGLFGNARQDQFLTDCLGAAMQLGKESIEKYLLSGDATLLGQRLGECVQTIKLTFTGYGQIALNESFAAASKIIERLLDLFNKNPDIWNATGLNEQDRDFMRGYVQIGNIYDRFADSEIKFNAATTKGIELSQEEKMELLVNAVIRRMVEKELIKDESAAEKSQGYQDKTVETNAKEAAALERLKQWVQENSKNYKTHDELDAAIKAQRLLFDVNAYKQDLGSYPVEHPIITKLAQPGMLERLRQNLMTDPVILEQAGKSPLDLTIDDLTIKRYGTQKIDALVTQVQPTMDKVEWFFNFKSMLSQEGLDPNVAANSDRLMITQTGAKGAKSLVSLASLLQGGLQALQDPDKNTLDLLYEHAKNGNLFFYGKDRDMPARLSADGAQVSAQQLEPHPQPTRWMRFWNAVTFGLAYAAECNPKPEIKLFTDGREARAASLQKADAPAPEQKDAVHTEEEKAEKTVQQPKKAMMPSALMKFEMELEKYAALKTDVMSIVMDDKPLSKETILDTMLNVARRSTAQEILKRIKDKPTQKTSILTESYQHFDAMIADIKEFLPKTYDPAELETLVEKRYLAANAQGEALSAKFDFIAETTLENYQNFVNAGKTDNFQQRKFDLEEKIYCEPLGVKKDPNPTKELQPPEKQAPDMSSI